MLFAILGLPVPCEHTITQANTLRIFAAGNEPAGSNVVDFAPLSFNELAAKKALTGGPTTAAASNAGGMAPDRLYPGLGHHLEEETTVAIDGAIHETAYFPPIRPGCEVFFVVKS